MIGRPRNDPVTIGRGGYRAHLVWPWIVKMEGLFGVALDRQNGSVHFHHLACS